MLKKITVLSLAILISACTLHPVKDKQSLCDQAKRQAVYNDTVPGLTTSQPNKVDKSIATNC